MVSIEKITYKLGQLDEFLSLLKKISITPMEQFIKDKLLIGSAKYYLQVSIECCLDVANHIIAAERFRAPMDYADSFKVLGENHVVPADQAIKLQRMAKFRNRLVHMYGEIDDEQVYTFIVNDITDIETFRSLVLRRFSSQALSPRAGGNHVRNTK
jgi:uncharacterized protein YutE (UPF0331/DUF86 family)